MVALQWRLLPLPALVFFVIHLPFVDAFLPGLSIPASIICPLRSPREHRSCGTDASPFSSVDEDNADDGYYLDTLRSCPALRRLNLTPDQAAVVQKRLNGITPRKHKRHRGANANNNGATVQTMERNLTYLQQKLNLSIEQLRSIVVGYPPVLSMGLESNLMPSIDFFEEGLSPPSNDKSIHHSIIDGVGASGSSRLATFLCESPGLLEYSVAKRLRPRLERVRSSMMISRDDDDGSGDDNTANVDEEVLRAIATLTDSRFEMWLMNLHGHDQNNGTQATISIGEHNTANGSSNAGAYSNPQEAPSQIRQPNNHPASYVILSNLQSGGNIGNIVRSASIFGCEECIVVGQKRYRMTGDHGSRLDLPRRHVYSHNDAREYLTEKGIRIYGIEIIEGAMPLMRYDRDTGVVKFAFDEQRNDNKEWRGAAFIFGNEGQGLSTKQREICDEFLFIPQNRGGSGDGVIGGGSSGGGSASMNVACAATVVLQAYCMWAGYPEAKFEGEKFLSS